MPAAILGLDGYGLAAGCNADFVLLQAADPIEAVRLRATRLAVVRRGRVIAETAPRHTPASPASTAAPPSSIDPAAYRPPVGRIDSNHYALKDQAPRPRLISGKPPSLACCHKMRPGATMPTVTIRNLSEATLRALRLRAAQHGRSMEAGVARHHRSRGTTRNPPPDRHCTCRTEPP